MPAAGTTRPSLHNLFQVLAEADGPPGREEAVRRLAAHYLSPPMHRVRVSPLGSLYAERPSSRGVRLMLTAPLDEAAFIVSYVDRDGIAWLHASGRFDPDLCLGAAIRFPGGIGATLGVIPSAATPSGPSRVLADFGPDGRGDNLRIGTMGVFATPWRSGRTTLGCKAFDGRLGAAMALEVARRSAHVGNALVLALTTHGQLGHRASHAAALDLAPAAAIALGAHPIPQKRTPGTTDVRPGEGPVILLRSQHFVADPRLVEELQRAAARASIRCQLAVGEDLTGAAAVRSSLEGISTAALLVPCLGVGSPLQQIETRDLDAAVELLVRLNSRPLDL